LRGGGFAAPFGAVDTDEYIVRVLSAGTLRVTLAFENTAADLDVIVLSRPAGEATNADVVTVDGASLANPEQAEVAVQAGDVLFLEVASYDDAVTPYQLTLTIE
jgi:hypothetical protein